MQWLLVRGVIYWYAGQQEQPFADGDDRQTFDKNKCQEE